MTLKIACTWPIFSIDIGHGMCCVSLPDKWLEKIRETDRQKKLVNFFSYCCSICAAD
jgi:hypothetical protein